MIKKKIKLVKILFLILVFLLLAIGCFMYYHTAVTENTDNFIYRLPFKNGVESRVVQGYGGLFSHRQLAAIDFEMPVGTAVCAARKGTVYSFKDNSNEGGLLSKYINKSNYIIIRHDDGSYGCYWHLKHKGVLVKRGQKVIEGQTIGWSGATGQVLRPHLHFSVKRKLDYNMNSFVKTKFKTDKGVVFLETRKSYIATED